MPPKLLIRIVLTPEMMIFSGYIYYKHEAIKWKRYQQKKSKTTRIQSKRDYESQTKFIGYQKLIEKQPTGKREDLIKLKIPQSLAQVRIGKENEQMCKRQVGDTCNQTKASRADPFLGSKLAKIHTALF